MGEERDLTYIAYILQKSMVDRTIYSRERLMIPTENPELE